MICQRNQGMTLQWNGAKISTKRFPVHINLPARCIRQLAGIPQLLEPLSPDVKEIAKGGGNTSWGLDMDHSGIIMCVQPIEARTIRGNPNIRRNGWFRSIYIHGHMRMNVRAALLSTLTGNVIYRRVRGIGGGLGFAYNQVNQGGNNPQQPPRDGECRHKPHPRRTPPLFLSPFLFLSPAFL